MKKKCSKCGLWKDVAEFPQREGKYEYRCGECVKQYNREWYLKNRDRRLKQVKEYRENNKPKVLEYGREWAKNNREKIREYNRRFQKRNAKEINKRAKAYHKKYYAIPKNRLSERIFKGIRYSIEKNRGGFKWEKCVGYTFEDLKTHFKKLFRKGMTWRLFKEGEIHIDHIIPISLWEFNSYDDREFKQCWALANLQPLWGKENRIKHNTTREVTD